MEWTPTRIRLLREAGLCMSQHEFARAVGFAKRTVGNAERGIHPPSLALRRALDQALEQASDAQRARFLAAMAADHPATPAVHGATPAIESVELLRQTEASDLGPGTLDQLDELVEHAEGHNRRDVLWAIGVGAAAVSPLTNMGQMGGVRELVLNAAHSSALLTSAVETPGIDPHTLEEAWGDLHRLATDYVVTSSLVRILHELVVLRDRLYVLLTHHRRRPADARELHLLLGATCVLLASISHDLGEPRSGMMQARAALTFAELSGHRALQTWVYCTKAMIASWWSSPENVLHHAYQAHKAGACAGVATIRLAGLQGRALAQLGKTREAVSLMNDAKDRREKLDLRDSSLQDFGDAFTFPQARQHYYNAATYTHFGDWQAVQRETETVVSLYSKQATSQCWPVTMVISRIYLAQARLYDAGPEGAWDALTPVFAIPAEQRVPQTAQALQKLRRQLHSPGFASLPSAKELDDAIHSFQNYT